MQTLALAMRKYLSNIRWRLAISESMLEMRRFKAKMHEIQGKWRDNPYFSKPSFLFSLLLPFSSSFYMFLTKKADLEVIWLVCGNILEPKTQLGLRSSNWDYWHVAMTTQSIHGKARYHSARDRLFSLGHPVYGLHYNLN